MSEFLSKEQIIKARDKGYEDVDVPEWNDGEACKVRVGMMSARDKDQFESEQFSIKVVNKQPDVEMHLENKSARLAARCIIDPETGRRMFSDDEIEILAEKSGAALARVVAVAQRLNGISNKDLKDLSLALKNAQPA